MATAAQAQDQGAFEETVVEERSATPTVVRELVRAADPDPMAIIEARNRAMERLLEYAIRSTSPEQWCDQNGKPYLMAGGAEAVARRTGIKFTNVSYEREDHTDELGSYYEYIYTGTVSLPGAYDRIEGIVGSCNSRDSMIGTNGGAKAQSDVDPGDIRKKAQTNMLQRGITQLLGLRNLDWSTLARFGVSPDGAAKVEYKAGAKGGGSSKGASATFEFKFGRAKGKTLEEVGDQDLNWYLGVFEKDVLDPEKAKYKANTEKGIATIKAELARRANAAAGVAPATDAKKASLWDRICALGQDLGIPAPEIGPIVKKATGKGNAKELVEADMPAINKALGDTAKAHSGDDIDL